MDTDIEVTEAIEGVGVAAKLIEIVLDLVGHDKANDLLSDAAVKRENALADLAEKAKFGP